MSASPRTANYWRAVIANTVPDAHGRPLIEQGRRELAAIEDHHQIEDTNMTNHTDTDNAALFAEMFGEPVQSDPGVPDDGRVRVVPGRLDMSEICARYTKEERDGILLAHKFAEAGAEISLTDEEHAAALVLAEDEERRLALSDATTRVNDYHLS